MSSFESFAPKPTREESAPSSAFEQRGVALENLAKKFPKFKSLMMTFVLTTAAFSAPEFLRASEPTPETEGEQEDTVSEKVTHEELKSAFSKLWERVDGLGTKVPENPTYLDTLEHLNANSTHTFSDTDSGTLPESAQDIVIGHEVATVTADHAVTGSTGDSVDLVQGMKSVFYVAPVEGGSITEGGTSQITGFGSTRAEALQNALESAVNFMGVDISSGSKLEDSSMTGDNVSAAESALTSHTETKSRHVLKGYKILEDVQPSGGVYADGQKSVWSDSLSDTEHRVTVEITGGILTNPAP